MPKKILFIHGGTLEKAGTESFMMNVLRHIDKSAYQIDFVVFGCKPGAYDDEVRSYGSKIYAINLFTLLKMSREIKRAGYDIVHAHMNALNALILPYFRMLGIKILISHSHGSRNFINNRVIDFLENQLKRITPHLTFNLLACSKEAGDFLYGKHPYTIINNGIDTTIFHYDPVLRNNIRKAMNIEDKLVIGAIGRLNFQKNHSFLLKVFVKIAQKRKDAVLLLIGDGELKENLQKQAETLKIEDHVHFLGIRQDVNAILSALDFVMMPSLFEGLPYALVEAQATGVFCLASDTIDQKTAMTGNFVFLPIDDPDIWANACLERLDYIRKDESLTIKEKGFDVIQNVKDLEHYYQKVL